MNNNGKLAENNPTVPNGHNVFPPFAFRGDLYCKKRNTTLLFLTQILGRSTRYTSTLGFPPLLRSDVRLVRRTRSKENKLFI